MSKPMTFDVVIATDCRFPGGNTSSVVEEIHAQHRAGYRTGLLHLPSPTLGRPRPFAPKIRNVLSRGEAELVVGNGTVETKLLLARHPSVFAELPPRLPIVHAEQVMMAVNNVPVDVRQSEPYYDVEHVQRQIRRFTGLEAVWAPIGPRIRAELEPLVGDVALLPWDWENVIDLDAWRVDRRGFVGDRPVIGRHSRGHWSKWPERPADLVAAYPTEPRYEVRILGGVQTPVEVLGRLPSNWVDLPFNSVPPRDYLAGIDFLVYFHHSGMIEAFGRVVLEALATGAVAIVPRYMEPLFGSACLYAEPAGVRGYVEALFADEDAFIAQSQAGVELVEKRFSYATHVERLTNAIGPPEATPAPVTTVRTRPRGALIADLRSGAADDVVATLLAAADLPAPRVAAVPTRVDHGQNALAKASKGNFGHDQQQAAGEVAVETFPRVVDELTDDDRRRYLDLRMAGLIRAHRPAVVVRIEDGDRLTVETNAAASEVTGRDLRQPGPGDEAAAQVDQVAGILAVAVPPEWVVRTVPRSVDASEQAARPGVVARALRRLRRNARTAVYAARRRRLARLKSGAKAANVMLVELDDAELALPVHTNATHPEPELLPVALVIATHVEPGHGAFAVRAIAERQQATGTFRAALLAPPSWEAPAAVHGLTIETLLPRGAWTELYGSGWLDYLHQRIEETCRVVHPVTVVQLGTGDNEDVDAALAVLESVRTRRRLGGGPR